MPDDPTEDPLSRAYKLVGEIISTATEIELQLLYISLGLSERAVSVSEAWHRSSTFRSKIDLTNVVVELTSAHTKTRKYWLAYKAALTELNGLRNQIAHGTLRAERDVCEDTLEDAEPTSADVYVVKINSDGSLRRITLVAIEETRDLMREALEIAIWFKNHLDAYSGNAPLMETIGQVEDLRRKAHAVKDRQSKSDIQPPPNEIGPSQLNKRLARFDYGKRRKFGDGSKRGPGRTLRDWDPDDPSDDNDDFIP